MAIIFKDWEKQPERITMIDCQKSLEGVRKWLTEIDQTFTEGAQSMSWKAIMKIVKQDTHFWKEVDQDGQPKPVGWMFLDAEPEESEAEDEEDDEDAYNPDEEESEGDDDDEEFDDPTDEEEEEEDEEFEDEDEDWEQIAR